MAGVFGDPHNSMAGSESFFEGPTAAKEFFRAIQSDLENTLASFSSGTRPLKFGRMFRKPNLPEFRPEPEGLIALGFEMAQATGDADRCNLPAGYTYLGQFIDHDMTFDKSQIVLSQIRPIEQIIEYRTPSLDLDSLYGVGPLLEKTYRTGMRIYEPDGIHLRFGETMADTGIGFTKKFPNDLPRWDLMPIYKASVADERNDENLAVAQTHVAFIKFHNKVVKHLEKDYTGNALFEAAREKVIKHYQWMILHDFLPRIIECRVLARVLREGCKHFVVAPDQDLFMPFEFSGAAFRLGHTLIRDQYEWNRFFQTGSVGAAELRDLFELGGFHGDLKANHSLMSTWIVDWTRMFDFTGFPGLQKNPKLNFAKKLDTLLTPGLDVPFPPAEPGRPKNIESGLSLDLLFPTPPAGTPPMCPLSVIDLLRGRFIGVPTAQSVVDRLRERASRPGDIKALTPAQLAGGHQKTLQNYGLHKLTPLWYYILRESEEFHQGERLGPVGSHIMAETFVGLIKASPISILKKQNPDERYWVPDLGPVKPKRFTMADLLYFVNDLNPLGSS